MTQPLTDEEKLELIARCQRLVDERGHYTSLHVRRFDLIAPAYTYTASVYSTRPDPLAGNGNGLHTLELRSSGAGRVFLVENRSRPDLASWGEPPYADDGTSRGWPPTQGRYRKILVDLRTLMVLDDLAGV